MGRLSINSKSFKAYHQKRLDEKISIANKKIEEETKLLKEQIEQREIKEESKKIKYSWRNQVIREFGEWAPIETSGPANSTTTTFGYFSGGSPVINGETGQQVTFTYSGLQGVENYPTTVTINQGFGDTFQTTPPPFSQVGVQGYTAKLNPRYAEAKKKYDEEWKEWERTKEQQRKDIEATLKSFGTSFKDLRSSQYIKKVGNSYVGLIVINPSRDFGSNLLNNVRVVRLVPCDPNKPMRLQRNIIGADGKKAWELSNAQYSDDVYLQIGEQPQAPIEQQYLIPRRTDFKDVNPQLDASQEFAQKVGADEFMNARVEDPGPTDAELESRSKLEIALNAKSDALSRQLEILYNQMNALPNGGRPIAYEIVEPGDPDYIDVTSLPNAIGYNRRPIYSAAANAIQAKIEALMNQQNAIFAQLNALSGAGPEKSGPEGDPSTWDPDGNGLYGPEPEKGEGDEEDPYAMEDPGVDPKDEEDLQDILDDLMNKAPGTLTPEEEKLLSDAGYDDYVRGGRTQASGVDAAGLGLSALGGLALGFSGAATGALASLSRAIKGKPPGPYAGKAPRPPREPGSSIQKEIWNTHTGKYDVIKNTDKGWDWAQRALRDTGPNSFQNYARTGEMPSGLKGWRPLQGFEPGRSAARGGFGSKPTPQVTSPGGIAATAGAGAGAYALGQGVANFLGLNPQQRRKRGMKESTSWDRINKYR